MARIQIVIDSRDPARLSEFWRAALHFDAEPPPPGYSTWAEFAERNGIPPERWADSAVDPDGVLPRIFFHPVPEAKTIKNRLHLDLKVADRSTPPDEQRAVIAAEVQRLTGLGATERNTVDSEFEGYWVVMQDPEGNEFCVA